MKGGALRGWHLLAFVAGSAFIPAGAIAAQSPPDRTYFGLVASTGTDQVTMFHFGPGGAAIEHRTPQPELVALDLVGPRELTVSPDRQFYLVTAARGAAYGQILRVRIADTVDRHLQQPIDIILSRETLGPSPLTVRYAPDNDYAWVTNFGIAPSASRSAISVIYLPQMVEVTSIPTCRYALGGAFTHDGTEHYSVCYGDDALVDINVAHAVAARFFSLAPGQERSTTTLSPPAANQTPVCAPVSVTLAAHDSLAYVACSRTKELVVVGLPGMTLQQRLPLSASIDQLVLTRDGTVAIGVSRAAAAVLVLDPATGATLATIPTSAPLPVGVVLTDDERYAFVSDEGIAGRPGHVDVIDLAARKRVASVEVGMQAAGIDFWRSVPACCTKP